MIAPGMLSRLNDAYRELQSILSEIDEDDRQLARDALRDAMDRNSSPHWRMTGFIADTFLVENILHQGSALEVMKLRHRDLGTFHALKTLRNECRDNPTWRAMLLREATSMLAAQHEAILPIRAVFRLPDGRPALLFDYIEGGTLGGRLERGSLAEEDARCLALRMLRALSAVHAQGLLHLDLSPQNILLRGGRLDDALLCDFGLALPAGASHAEAGLASAQTAPFAAPEQVGGAQLDVRTDLFSLGAVIQRCLQDASVQSPLLQWARRLCEPQPENRPATSDAALQMLHIKDDTS